MTIEPNAEQTRLAAVAMYWMYDGIEERLKAREPGEVVVPPLPEGIWPDMMISILMIAVTKTLQAAAIAAGVSAETFLDLARRLADQEFAQLADEAGE